MDNSLSEKIWFASNKGRKAIEVTGQKILLVKDVKDFIKKLKKEIDRKFDEMRKGWYETDNPDIAQQRMNDSHWINIIDDIDKLAGEKLK